MQEVIGKVLLDAITLVAEADDKFIKAVVGVNLHDVPQNWLLANLDHRLGLQVGFFRNTGTEPSGKDNYFHANDS